MDFNENEEILESKVESIMREFTSLLGGCHIECDAAGLITKVSIPVDKYSDSWETVIGSSIDEFLEGVKYINSEGEEVELDLDSYTEEDFLQCVKYFMGAEAIRRAELVHVSRDEYLAALLSGDVKSSIEEMIKDKSETEREISYEDSLYADLEWSDVAKAVTPAFREMYIKMLSSQISTAIELLTECSEDDIAALNIERLEELEEKISEVSPEEILPEEAFEDFYASMKDYQADYSYGDLIGMDSFYGNLISECQQYTYTLPEVAKNVFENSDTDSYTLDADKETLHKLVETHPTQISKDGVPYTPDEIDTMVELASVVGWEAANYGIGEDFTK